MARAVHVEQPPVDRDVTAQLRAIGHAERAQPTLQRPRQRPFAADQQSPGVGQPGQDVSQQQRVLLLLQPPHAERAKLAVVRSGRDRLGGRYVRLRDQRHRQLENSPHARVAAGQLRSHDDRRMATREDQPGALERVPGQVDPAASRMAVAHVCRQVLANPEHDPAAAEPRERREGQRHRVRAEQPHRVDAAEHCPEAPGRARQRPSDRAGPCQALVVRQRDELKLVRQAVVRAPTPRVEPPHDHEPIELLAQPGEKERERALRIDRIALAVVDVVRIYGDAHAGYARLGVRLGTSAQQHPLATRGPGIVVGDRATAATSRRRPSAWSWWWSSSSGPWSSCRSWSGPSQSWWAPWWWVPWWARWSARS